VIPRTRGFSSSTNVDFRRILTVVFDPAALDFSKIPGVDEAAVTACRAGEEEMRAQGFDFVACQVTPDPDEAELKVRECAAAGPFGVAMIGGGIRMAPENTLLFERLVNVIAETWPGIAFCFNTSPETGIDALRRWVPANAGQ
jgi:hypothetical protein